MKIRNSLIGGQGVVSTGFDEKGRCWLEDSLGNRHYECLVCGTWVMIGCSVYPDCYVCSECGEVDV